MQNRNDKTTIPSKLYCYRFHGIHKIIDFFSEPRLLVRMRTSESTVPGKYCGERIDRYLALRFTYMSRNEWQREISSGQVLVNGIEVSNHHKKIREGDLIIYKGRMIVEPEIERGYSIIYEDPYLLCVNKPGNIPVHPSGVFYHNTLLTLLQQERGERLHPMHRLDRETSGAIIFARDRETASIIQSSFNRLVSKSYLAIVHGRPEKTKFTVDLPLGPDPASAIRKKKAAYHGAPVKALTLFTALYSRGDYTLIKAEPKTGRQHQIRAHLLHAGFPLLGDKLYGIDEKLYLQFTREGNSPSITERLGFPRCALHSRRLLLRHPRTGARLRLTAPMPEDFRNFLAGQNS
ncbi:MAG TPA: RluA family pseudouridine synthase [Spirochaetota bacterium]|nr:RluA family pseudouridine synthase [Spirochaetota bacterium]HPR50109.1 RluA family pseudouridine synthase [Spirochaetota bacterium]